MRGWFAACLAVWSAHGAVAEPLPAHECLELRDAVEAELRLSPAFRVTEDAAADMAPLTAERACNLSFEGSGVLFEREGRVGFQQAEQAFRDALEAAGWSDVMATTPYAAGGPLGARFGVASGERFCLATVEVSAKEGAAGGDRIDAAAFGRLTASQRRYHLALDCIDRVEE